MSIKSLRSPLHLGNGKIFNDDGEIVDLNNHQESVVFSVNMHDRMANALQSLFIQALQSNIIASSNEYGQEAMTQATMVLQDLGMLKGDSFGKY